MADQPAVCPGSPLSHSPRESQLGPHRYRGSAGRSGGRRYMRDVRAVPPLLAPLTLRPGTRLCLLGGGGVIVSGATKSASRAEFQRRRHQASRGPPTVGPLATTGGRGCRRAICSHPGVGAGTCLQAHRSSAVGSGVRVTYDNRPEYLHEACDQRTPDEAADATSVVTTSGDARRILGCLLLPAEPRPFCHLVAPGRARSGPGLAAPSTCKASRADEVTLNTYRGKRGTRQVEGSTRRRYNTVK
jgi:hypothetical protein